MEEKTTGEKERGTQGTALLGGSDLRGHAGPRVYENRSPGNGGYDGRSTTGLPHEVQKHEGARPTHFERSWNCGQETF